MKYGLYILLLAVFVACRSNRTMDRTTESKSVAEETDTITQVDSTRITAEQRDSTSTVTNVSLYAKTTFFGDSGRISAVREEWWEAGSTGVAVRSGRTSEVHVTDRKEASHKKMEQNSFDTIKEAEKIDSRMIQGVEWLYVISGIAVFLALAFFLFKKFKK